jgi:hypothetical protein
MTGEGPSSFVKVKVEAVPQDDGNYLRGYIRLAHTDAMGTETAYVGWLSVPRLLRLADAIRAKNGRTKGPTSRKLIGKIK